MADLLWPKVTQLPTARTPEERAHAALCEHLPHAGPEKRLSLPSRDQTK